MDTFSWITETAKDFQPLFERMDKDKDLYNQLEYKLKNLKDGKPAKNVVNITMNDAKVFADRSIAFMNEATMQTIVEGKNLQDRDSTLIEEFDRDTRYEIDLNLMLKDINSLYAFLIEQSVVRGTVGARLASWQDGDRFNPDLLPCDSRYLIYEYGRKELEQSAFRTVRSKSSILQEYPKANVEGTVKKGGIWEYWDKEKCEIWLGNPTSMSDASGSQLLSQKENIFGYVPFIIVGVGTGSMLQDDDSMEHRFESIFSANRLLYAHVNMLGSILQTLNYMSFSRTYQWESESGTLAQKPPEPGSRETIPVDKGTRGLFPIEIADVNNATRLFQALLMGAVQRGSLPNIDYGNLTFPLSAVAISRLTQTKDAIFTPRLQAISWFYRKLHYMIRDQYVKGGYRVELGEEGFEKTYNASDLDKKYKISYKFHAVSPEQDVANYAIAQQALAVGMSRHTVYTNILKLENPDGEIMEARSEKAEQLDPIIGQFRYGHALIDQGTEESFLEADLVADSIDRMLRMRYTPSPEVMTQGAPQVQGRSLVPLLEGGGGKGTPMNEMEGMNVAPEEMMNREERRAEIVRKQSQES